MDSGSYNIISYIDIMLTHKRTTHVNLHTHSVKEMEKEFADLKLELKELEREVEYHQSRSSPADPDDLFLPTTEGFVSSTKEEFKKFEELLREMKRKFEDTLVYFGEDAKNSGAPSIEELFSNFAVFLQSFNVSLTRIATIGMKAKHSVMDSIILCHVHLANAWQ